MVTVMEVCVIVANHGFSLVGTEAGTVWERGFSVCAHSAVYATREVTS